MRPLERVEVARFELSSPRVVIHVGVVRCVLVELLHRYGGESVEGCSVSLVWETKDVEEVEEGGEVGS